jgi:hypothetical protein
MIPNEDGAGRPVRLGHTEQAAPNEVIIRRCRRGTKGNGLKNKTNQPIPNLSIMEQRGKVLARPPTPLVLSLTCKSSTGEAGKVLPAQGMLHPIGERLTWVPSAGEGDSTRGGRRVLGAELSKHPFIRAQVNRGGGEHLNGFAEVAALSQSSGAHSEAPQACVRDIRRRGNIRRSRGRRRAGRGAGTPRLKGLDKERLHVTLEEPRAPLIDAARLDRLALRVTNREEHAREGFPQQIEGMVLRRANTTLFEEIKETPIDPNPRLIGFGGKRPHGANTHVEKRMRTELVGGEKRAGI